MRGQVTRSDLFLLAFAVTRLRRKILASACPEAVLSLHGTFRQHIELKECIRVAGGRGRGGVAVHAAVGMLQGRFSVLVHGCQRPRIQLPRHAHCSVLQSNTR